MPGLILIADDDAEFRTVLKGFLEMHGNRVLEAADGSRAFALAEQARPQLIILDVVMPGLYGSTVLKLIREYPGFAETPIIVVSGTVDALKTLGIQEAPNVRFMPKPVDLDALEAAIRELLP